MDLIVAYKKAFSLWDEIGKCPDIKVNIEVNDPSTFFVRPFPIAEEDKPLMDKCMQKMVLLGILTKNSTTHTSAIMLVASVMLLHCSCLSLNPFIEFRIREQLIKF